MIADLVYARDLALLKKRWVVVVIPPEVLGDAQDAMAAVAGGNPFGGRTVAFPNGSRLSIVLASDPLFVSGGETFDVMFLGWGGDRKAATTAKEMSRWRSAAKKVLSRAA